MASAINIGDILEDNVRVFRAFAEKSFRSRTKNRVRYFAYLLRDEDVRDGLSVGLSPDSAVKYLKTNEGYCQIMVGAIHGLNFDLQVRRDATDPDHAFICNLPLQTISDEERQKAAFIANRLADQSQIVTCDPYVPPPAI
jgi:hypothetical protein